MKAYYKINGEKVTQIFLETYDKLADINLELFTEQECVMNGELVVQPDDLKCIDGVIVAKDDMDYVPELIIQCKSRMNEITESTIYAGFEWPPIDGVQFQMTAENQRNFSNLYTLAKDGFLTYPYTVWCGDEEVELADATEVATFYLAGVSFITETLSAGKATKATFSNMTRAELIQWLVDNQSEIM